MITIIQKQSALSIRAGNLEVKLASNLTEIDAAMRLRSKSSTSSFRKGWSRPTTAAMTRTLTTLTATT